MGLEGDVNMSSSEEALPEAEIKNGLRKGPFRIWKFLLMLILGGFVLLLGTGAFFYWQISRPQKVELGVTYNRKDFQDFVDKSGIEVETDNYEELCVLCNVTYQGQQEADFTLTDEQVSAWMSEISLDSRFTGIQFKFTDNQVESSSTFHYQGQSYPLYGQGVIEKAGPKSIKISLAKAKVGAFPLPQKLIDQVEETGNRLINQKLAEISNLRIDRLETTTEGLVFKGVVPQSVTPQK